MELWRLVLLWLPWLVTGAQFPTSLPGLHSDLARAQELLRLTGKAKNASTVPELVDVLTSLELTGNVSSVGNVTSVSSKDGHIQLAELATLAQRLVETLHASVKEAEALQRSAKRRRILKNLTGSIGPCRKRSHAFAWLTQLRSKLPEKLKEQTVLHQILGTMKQHVQRIREEAWMGKFALNSSVKLHQEAAEQEQYAKKEYQNAMAALMRVNNLIQERKLSLETDLPLPTSTKDVKAHKSHEVHGSTISLEEFAPPFPAPFQKDGKIQSEPCKKAALKPFETIRGTADSIFIPDKKSTWTQPVPVPVSSTVTTSISSTTSATTSKHHVQADADPSPDMPRIFIPGTPDPDISSHADTTLMPSTTTVGSWVHDELGTHVPRVPSTSSVHPTTTTVSASDVDYITDPEVQVLMTERHRLVQLLPQIQHDIAVAEKRLAGLLKARLVADDAALQLELASKRHKEAIEVVVGKLNATDQKVQSVRGQMRIFSAAVERLKQCLDPEEEKKRQPFVQQLQEEEQRMREENEALSSLAEQTAVMWKKVATSLTNLRAMKDGLWRQSVNPLKPEMTH